MYTMKHRNHLRGKEREGHSFVQVCFLQTTILPLFFQMAEKLPSMEKFSLSYQHGIFNSQQHSCSLKALSLQKSIFANMGGPPNFFYIVHNQVCVFHHFLVLTSLAHITTTNLYIACCPWKRNAVALELASDLHSFHLFLQSEDHCLDFL